MSTEVVLVLVALGALVLLAQFVKSGGKAIGGLPVMARPLMTDIERRTIGHLETALPGTRIHAQVSMGALIAPKKGLDRQPAPAPSTGSAAAASTSSSRTVRQVAS